MLVSVGVSTLNRTYESYDGLFGSPDGFGDALAWHDSATVVGQYSGAEQEQVATNWKSSYQSPDLYYAGQFPFQRLGDVTTGWNKNARSTLGLDAGLTWQMGDHEIRAGFDMKNYKKGEFCL